VIWSRFSASHQPPKAGERKFRVRNSVRKLAILAAPLLFFTAFAAWAPSASADTAIAIYQYEGGNPSTLPCLVYSSGSLYLQGGCSTQDPSGLNHAALWDEISEPAQNGFPTYELENVHTPQCLTSTSSGPGVYMGTCGSNHVQWWELVATSSNTYVFVNAHTNDDLDISGNFAWQIAS
jgi:hypothetical protein